MSRFVYAMPMVAVVFVMIAIFGVGRARPYVGARIWGGPTEGARHLAWRIEVVERLLQLEDVSRVRRAKVEAALADGRRGSATVDLDSTGTASAVIDVSGPVRGPVSVVISADGVRNALARGSISLTTDEWRRGSTSSGGFERVSANGALSLALAPERGVLAVPFRDAVILRVEDDEGPVENAELAFEPVGVDLHPRGRTFTDARGRARLEVTPIVHLAEIGVVATAPDGRQGRATFTLPIAPGAIDARSADGRLRVRSPIVRDAAWISIVTESERIDGWRIVLTPDGRGGSVAELPLAPEGATLEKSWAVVSSESDMASMALVGWPLGRGDEPGKAFAARDRLLIDGLVEAHVVDTERRARARWLALVFCVLSAAFVGFVLVRRARRSAEELALHLRAHADSEEDARAIAPGRSTAMLTMGVAVVAVLLGFAVIALIAMVRLG